MNSQFKSMLFIAIFWSLTSQAQENWGSFTKLKEINIEDSQIDSWQADATITGFCYGGGYIWLMNRDAQLIKIDTTNGSIINVFNTPAFRQVSWYEGAICYDEDVLWILTKNKIMPIDTTGQKINDGIDISAIIIHSDLNSRNSIVKDQTGFWIKANQVIRVDFYGNLVRRFANAWFAEASISLLNDQLLFSTKTIPPGNINDWYNQLNYSVITLDTINHSMINCWNYPGPSRLPDPDGYVTHLGFSVGENCIWGIEEIWRPFANPEIDGYRIRKLTVPAPEPFPQFDTKIWGEFKIVEWNLSPTQGEMIEGLHGLDYHNNQLWINNGYYYCWRYDHSVDGYFYENGRWSGGVGIIARDICFVGEDLWIASDWPGITTGAIIKITPIMSIQESYSVDKQFDVQLPSVTGIASDDQSIWVSGDNILKKYNTEGDELAVFSYAGKIKKPFADLTWHKGSIWAITEQDNHGHHIYVYQIDPSNGEIIREYSTGWARPRYNIQGNIASDGEHLLIISIIDPDRNSDKWDCFENTHEVLLKLTPIQIPDKPQLTFPENGANNQAFSINLQWNPVADAGKYHIQVSNDMGFNDLIIDDSTIVANSTLIASLMNNKVYFWRVCAIQGPVVGPWSEIFSFTTVSTNVDENVLKPFTFQLGQNYPNPFNPNTTIKFSVPYSMNVLITVYNLHGSKIREIIADWQEAGTHYVHFSCEGLASGIYYYQIRAGKFQAEKKMIIIK